MPHTARSTSANPPTTSIRWPGRRPEPRRSGSCRACGSLSSREALGVTSELAGTRQRAEEVGALLVHEPSGGAVRIDDHPADRIDGESIALPNSERREDLDRFGDVAQR